MSARRRVKDQCAEDAQLREALAVLISSTRSRKRPVPLTEVARWLEVALKKLGSYFAVADRIGLSAKMLRQFSYVSRLSPPVRRLFESRKLDSVDAAVHLSMFLPKEQRLLSKRAVTGDVDTSDIRAVLQLRRSGRRDSVEKLLAEVTRSKKRREYIAEFVVRGARSREHILGELQKHIPGGGIIRLEIEGALGRLVLSEEGRQALYKTSRALRVPLKHVIPAILED